LAVEIIVCIKQVPDPEHFSKISLDPVTKTITREGIPAVINPVDRNALEEGLRMRERYSGKVAVVTMGPPQARRALEEALAMGADKAFLLCDTAFAEADTLATAYSLACTIRAMGNFDLILCGNETADSGTAQVGPQLAEFLGMPCVSNVKEITVEGEMGLLVKQALEGGYMTVKVRLPALITVTKEINRPRLVTAFGIMEAAEKEINERCCTDVELDPSCIGRAGSPTEVLEPIELPRRRKGEIMTGPPEEMVRKAMEKIRELGVADLLQ
jgi:electron transfer flavoprotein beta subunit